MWTTQCQGPTYPAQIPRKIHDDWWCLTFGSWFVYCLSLFFFMCQFFCTSNNKVNILYASTAKDIRLSEPQILTFSHPWNRSNKCKNSHPAPSRCRRSVEAEVPKGSRRVPPWFPGDEWSWDEDIIYIYMLWAHLKVCKIWMLKRWSFISIDVSKKTVESKPFCGLRVCDKSYL